MVASAAAAAAAGGAGGFSGGAAAGIGAAASGMDAISNAAGTIFTAKKANQAAYENRKFQALMSNTAHRREVMDLRAAGLNPILSAMGGPGASSPAGNMAQVPDFGRVRPGEMLHSAMAARTHQEALKKLRAERKQEEFKLPENWPKYIEGVMSGMNGILGMAQTELPQILDMLKDWFPGSAKETNAAFQTTKPQRSGSSGTTPLDKPQNKPRHEIKGRQKPTNWDKLRDYYYNLKNARELRNRE